tara:strand:+ start:1632 stop:2237 length:606 start_codon:yes stop_codon:yes gene_type:complete
MQDIYGYGVIKNTIAPDRDSQPMLAGQRTVDKDPIYTNDHLKVNKSIGVNYYKDYMNEPISETNYEERDALHMDDAIDYLEAMPNINLDMDGDGEPDQIQGEGIINNAKAAEFSEQIQEQEDEPVQVVEEKSIKFAEPIVADVESVAQLAHVDKKNPLEVNKDNKLNTLDTIKNSQIKASDILTMGAGGLALALMAFGRNA